jgi:hypothetical protein
MKNIGENAKPDSQVSPDKLLRAALLRSRYADVIVKAHGVLSQVCKIEQLVLFFNYCLHFFLTLYTL